MLGVYLCGIGPNSLPKMNMGEDAEQRITFLLQEIDTNICAAHRSATQICTTIRRHHQILRQLHERTQIWTPLFDSFMIQPTVTRRPGITPAHSTTMKVMSPLPEDNELAVERSLNFSDEEEENPTFKTTKLRHFSENSMEKSFDTSINSDNLPEMSRTPYMKAAGFRSQYRSMQSPRSRTIATPSSAISSIAPTSPGLHTNLMEASAFEFTPPHDKKRQRSEREKSPNTLDDTTGNSPSQRKRKRPTSQQSPTHTTPNRRASAVVSTPTSFANLRRRYSTSEYNTPRRSTHTTTTVEKSNRGIIEAESPITPNFEISPLLRTQLKVMTPRTPVSNRLVGADFEIGSTKRETELQEYDESSTSGKPAPEFQLSLFPSAFQVYLSVVFIMSYL